MHPSRLVAFAAALLVATGCARRLLPVEHPPGPDLARQPGSLVYRAISTLFQPSGIPTEAWDRPTGTIIVIEKGVPSRYNALVIELVYDSMPNPSRCREPSMRMLFGWKIRADSTGIDAFTLYASSLDPIGITFVGPIAPCPNLTLWPLPLGVFSIAGRTYFNQRMAIEGEVYLQPFLRSPTTVRSPPCMLDPSRTSTNLWPERCEQRRYNVRVRNGVVRPLAEPGAKDPPAHRFLVDQSDVPGLRLIYDCRPKAARSPACIDSYSSFKVPGLPPAGDRNYFSPDTTRFLTTWGDQPVFRTHVMLRFRPGLTDSAKRAFFERTLIAPRMQGRAGSFIAAIPDPGPGLLALDVELARLQKMPEVLAAYPILVKTGVPPLPTARLRAAVIGPDNRPLGQALVCWGLDPGRAPSQWRRCKVTLDDGSAELDGIEVDDVPVYAACRDFDEDRVVPFDSVYVATEPRQLHKVVLGPLRTPCKRAP